MLLLVRLCTVGLFKNDEKKHASRELEAREGGSQPFWHEYKDISICIHDFGKARELSFTVPVRRIDDSIPSLARGCNGTTSQQKAGLPAEDEQDEAIK